jgi:drug/metabolite transporter (DMT)-like permease
MLGVFFAVLATATFSVNSVLARRGLASAAASAGAFVTVLIGVPFFFLAALGTGQLFNAGGLELTAYGYLALAGIIHFGVGRYLNYRAASAIGATRVGPIQSFTIPYAVLVAFITLDETINIGMAIGIALILVGPLIMVERMPAKKNAPVGASGTRPASTEAEGEQAQFELRQGEGYLFAFLSVFAYGTSPILIRAALADVDDMAVFGGLVAYTAASVALIATLVIPARRGLISAMNPGTIRLFLGAGFFVFLAQMFRFIALSLVPVAVVTPLQRAGAVFTLILSWAINRHLEVIDWRVVLGIGISVVGSVVLIVERVD